MSRKKRPAQRAKKKSRFPVFKTLAWVAVILLTSLSLLVALRLPQLSPPIISSVVKPVPPPDPVTQIQKSKPVVVPTPVQPQEKKTKVEVQKSSSPAPLVYEVPMDDFESKVREVDLAILESLVAVDQDHHALQHKIIESRTHNGQEFFYQNLTIALPDIFYFLEELQNNLAQHAPQAKLSVVEDNPRDLEISILGQPTHHLYIPLSIPPRPEKNLASRPCMVVVIDDLGESMAVAKRLANLSVPITFSVLPYTTRARDVANLARKNSRELLLHLPCEPEGYPKRADSGPGTLKVSMSPAILEQTLMKNLAQLPEVDGVNNHMGSRLTRDKKAMTVVLAHLQGRGKFFLDSLTTPRSVIQEVSSNLGMDYYRRNIFLDNTQSKSAILLQLKKAESLAKRTGLAVAIGHPYPETLQALESWTKSRDLDITICRLQDI